MEDRPFSDISYRKFLEEEKLMGSKCGTCSALFAPPRSICIQCHGSDMEWIGMSGTGVLAAFTCIAIGPASMIAEGYDRENPYCVGVVELAEGPRVDARIEGVDTTNPEAIRVGMPLKAKFLKTCLGFEPLGA